MTPQHVLRVFLAAVLISASPSAFQTPVEPPEPAATPAVQALLTNADRLAHERHPDDALAAADQALALALKTKDIAGEAGSQRARASRLAELQRLPDAAEAWRQAAPAWASVGDGPGQVEALAGLGVALIGENADQSRDALSKCLALGRAERQRPLAAAKQLTLVSAVLAERSMYEQALGLASAALAIQQASAPDSVDVARTLNVLGVIEVGRGAPAAAREHHLEAQQIFEAQAPNSLDYAATLDGLGNAALGTNDYDTAEQFHTRALHLRETLAPNSLDHAASINALGRIAQSRGDVAGARELYDRAYDMRRVLAPDSLTVAASLNNLGLTASGRGDWTAAREFHERALAIRKRLAPETRLVASSFQSLGMAATRRLDFVEARRDLEESLRIRRAVAPGSALEATSLDALGRFHWAQQEFTIARDYLSRALAMLEQLEPDSLDVGRTVDMLGTVALDEGRDLAGARRDMLRALDLFDKYGAQALAAGTLNRLTMVGRNSGDLVAAEAFAARGLALNLKIAPGSSDVAYSLNELGDVALSRGDLDRARDYYLRAQALYEQNKEPDSVVTEMKRLANVAVSQGDVEAAASLAERALAAEQKDPTVLPGAMAETFGILADIAWERGDPATARSQLQKVLATREKGSPESLEVADCLRAMAFIAIDQDDLVTARDLSGRALTLLEKLAPDSLLLADGLSTVGRLRLREGQLAEAQGVSDRALRILQTRAPGSLAEAELLSQLAEVAFQAGDVAAAVSQGQRAEDIIKRQGATIAGDETRQAFGRQYGDIGANLVRYLIRAGKTDEAFAALEEGRAQSLLQLIADRGVASRLVPPQAWQAHEEAAAVYRGASDRLERAEAARVRAQNALDAEVAQQASAESIAEHRRVLTLAQATLETARTDYAEARLRAENRWAAVRQSVDTTIAKSMDPARARQSLQPGDLFLSFHLAAEGSVLFALDGTGHLSAFDLKIPQSELEKRVAYVLRATAGEAGRRSVTLVDPDLRIRAARTLYDALFPAEVQAAILKARRIVVSPDGVLWDLPFAALVVNDAHEYLGLLKPLVYEPSLTVFAQEVDAPAAKAKTRPDVLVVANPAFDTAGHKEGELGALNRGEALPPLPSAEQEGRRVAALYGTTAKTGAEPTEAWFRQHAGQADIIHLATHGYFNPYRALSSGVMFAAPAAGTSADGTSNDGALQAWEVLGDLKINADLVVLSACETGVGASVRSEGLVGLTRAFQIAGAKSVAASQWQVADASTAELMVAFHEGLRAGLPKDEALRRAMVKLAGNPATAHPFHWAAFVLVGDYRPISARR